MRTAWQLHRGSATHRGKPGADVGGRKSMAVFEYAGVVKNREDVVETGTVIAKSEDDARGKLRGLGFKDLRLKKLGGVSSLIRQFSADVR
jgi:hypothetical protein